MKEIDYKKTIEEALIGYYISTVSGKFLYANKKALEVFGYLTFEELSNVNIPEDIYYNKEDREKFLYNLKTYGKVESFKINIKTQEGSIRSIIYSGKLINDEIIEGWIIDITEHERIKKEHELFTRVIEENTDAIFITDRKGSIIYKNKKFDDIIGKIGKNTYAKDILPITGRRDQKIKSIISNIKSTGYWIGELNIINDKDQLIPCGVKIFALFNSENKIENYISVFRDISEKKKLEFQLKHAQKMEILGELSSAVIHDINNLITSLNYNIELIAMVKNKKPDKIDKYLNNMEKTIENAQTILKKLLTFSQKPQMSIIPIKLSEVFNDILIIISTFLKKKNITINFQDNTKDFIINANKSSFIQMLMNLIINAIDAIGEKPDTKGIIDISADIIEIKEKHFVRINISDNGIGIDKQIEQKVFEPFFTTKGNKGSGLGLSIVLKEINELKGKIFISSEKGVGTKFTIILPASKKSIYAFNKIPFDAPNILQNKLLTILDDDDDFRNIIGEYIEFYGIKVKSFATVKDFILFLENSEPDILILDYILDSAKTAESILEFMYTKRVKAPVIIISGYVDSSILELQKFENVKMIIEKPVSGKELIEKIKLISDEIN